MHVYTVGRSAIALKLKVNGKSEIFSKSTVKLQHFFDVLSRTGQGSSKILAIKLARACSMQCCNKNFRSRL